MEHLKNIGVGAAATAIVVLALALIVLLGVLCMEALEVLARHWPGAGPAMFWIAAGLAALWMIGRTFRRQAT